MGGPVCAQADGGEMSPKGVRQAGICIQLGNAGLGMCPGYLELLQLDLKGAGSPDNASLAFRWLVPELAGMSSDKFAESSCDYRASVAYGQLRVRLLSQGIVRLDDFVGGIGHVCSAFLGDFVGERLESIAGEPP